MMTSSLLCMTSSLVDRRLLRRAKRSQAETEFFKTTVFCCHGNSNKETKEDCHQDDDSEMTSAKSCDDDVSSKFKWTASDSDITCDVIVGNSPEVKWVPIDERQRVLIYDNQPKNNDDVINATYCGLN